ncbi:Autophagy protein 22, variant 2 [Exophiala dermatitidis]|nr:Autophagy protein 22 [Exophiala dermatitidis]KAJ4534592.1 Autophagy protein 22, variant 2 [Exophiala dermatitidis]KAJ4541577.1 Autophagy protein 22 [Exophiala dermatitidis]KAJ4551063.1 Autophagy protein 22, variant 2 [Exophiala dermatitidis]KAJ4560936.1 Autophagy protein 22, variant 2 [Exophiala dermatitidis]
MDDLDQVAEEGHYEDEDTRPTSRKELWGWYSYGWAAEVFAICAMGSFLPITLEQLARDRGVLLSDKKTPCNAGWQNGGDTSPAGRTVFDLPKHRHNELPPCVIYVLGAEINTASFAMYTFSISVLIQALLIISMSAAADHGRFRKTFLLVFAFTGATATALFIAVVPKVYLLGALLAMIANTCFGASFVLLNSFLPLLVRYHPSIDHGRSRGDLLPDDVRQREDDEGYDEPEDDNLASSTSALLPRDVSNETPSTAVISPELKLSTKISSNGIGIGYIAGLFVQAVAILIVVATGSTTFSLRLVLMVVGLWWFVFSIPAALWLRPRPGPPLPTELTGHSGWVGYVTYAWKALFKTIGHARRLKDLVIFLCAWFLLSDSIATVSGTAVLFAKTSLGMKTEALGLINVIAMTAGVIGAFYWSFVSRVFNLSASRTIVACICLFEIIPLYGLLGFIPAIKRYGVFGLQQPWEMYPLGAVYGFVLGGLSSYCRAFFGELIPPGFEAAFYALYAITDKGSSIFGPAIVGAITDRYGEIRPAFVFLAVLIFLPLPLMLLVDVDRGKAEASTMSLELEGKRQEIDRDARYTAIPTIVLSEEED